MIPENIYHTAERQNVLLEMMKEIHAFLEEHQISYSLSSGSLLGAIRHNGFIPWDDDIDILVDRQNYQRLLAVFSECENYVIRRTLWINRIVRKGETIQGLNTPTIDIFVLDYTPHNTLKRKYQLFRLMMLQGMMKESTDYSSFSFIYRCCLRVTHFLGRFSSDEKKFARYERVSQMGDPEKASSMTCCNDPFRWLPLCYDKNVIEKTSLHIFEDTEFRILDRYDHYLTVHYGDYMTPPPQEDRKPIHMI